MGVVISLTSIIQVVAPFLTEPWSATRDAPDAEAPTCTLRNFPYAASHATSWAAELLSTLFTARPRTVNSYLSSKSFVEELLKKPAGEVVATAAQLHECLVRVARLG